MTNDSNGTGPREERAPTAAWRLTPELSTEEELAIRKWAIEGLTRRREQEDS